MPAAFNAVSIKVRHMPPPFCKASGGIDEHIAFNCFLLSRDDCRQIIAGSATEVFSGSEYSRKVKDTVCFAFDSRVKLLVRRFSENSGTSARLPSMRDNFLLNSVFRISLRYFKSRFLSQTIDD